MISKRKQMLQWVARGKGSLPWASYKKRICNGMMTKNMLRLWSVFIPKNDERDVKERKRFTSIFITCYFDEYLMFYLLWTLVTSLWRLLLLSFRCKRVKKLAQGRVEKCISKHQRYMLQQHPSSFWLPHIPERRVSCFMCSKWNLWL